MKARRKLIAELSEDSLGGIATLQDVERAERLVDAHRAEVLAEAETEIAAAIDRNRAEHPDSESMMTRRLGMRAAERVVRGMREDAEKSSPTEADATPAFFEPGHTYTDGNGYRAPELTTIFRVEHVTRHPDRGHLRAIGWVRSGEPGAKWHGDFRDEGEFRGWTITTTGEDGRS